MLGETILLVEDDEVIADLVEMYLQKNGYHVVTAMDESLFDAAMQHEPDLILLDILLPGLDGVEVCQRLRTLTDVPILFMTCKAEESDKILGLAVGGDDYITKPFSPAVLVARVGAHLRRYRTMKRREAVSMLTFPGLEIDTTCCSVRRSGRPVGVTMTEFQLLSILARHAGQTLSDARLFSEIRQAPQTCDTRTIQVHISNLRKKIETNPSRPEYILTVRGHGYRFNPRPIGADAIGL